MVTHTGRPGAQKRPALSKATYQYVRNGRLITAKWPRKRGRPKHPTTRDQNEWFRQANLAAKFVNSAEQWMAQELAKHGPLYPRDLLMSAMAGTLFPQLEIDGQVYTSMALVTDISKDLDLLAGNTPGTIMWRGPQRWQGLAPGSAGQLLALDNSGQAVEWADPSITGAKGYAFGQSNGVVTAASVPTKGFIFTPVETVTLHQLGAFTSMNVGDQFRLRIFEVNDFWIIQQKLADTVLINAPNGLDQYLWADLQFDAVLEVGKNYAVVLSLTNRGNSAQLQLHNIIGAAAYAAMPIVPPRPPNTIYVGCNIAKASPVNGDTFNTFAGPAFPLAFGFTI